jgi:hypothetical protein
MKSMKKILALVVVVVMAFGMITAFAADETPELEGTQKTDRFELLLAEYAYGDASGTITMISADGELVIHIHDDTPIYFEDETDVRERLEGQTLEALLDGRKLTVTYMIVAQSMPPQTSPTMVVVWFETAVHLPGTVVDELSTAEANPLNGEVVVNNEIIEAPAPFWNEDGVIMVPLRAIAEALGYDVNWDSNVQGIRLGVAINLWVGQDNYTVGRMAPIELGTAPVIVDDRTFVPMTFFREVVSNVSIIAFEGQIVVADSLEYNDME